MGSLFVWVHSFGQNKTIELICPHQNEPAACTPNSVAVVTENCLADSSFELPFELLACGAGRVIIRGDSCPLTTSAERTARWLQAGYHLEIDSLEVVDFPNEFFPSTIYHAAHMPTASRRDLFGLTDPTKTDGFSPDESLTSHQRLRAAVRWLKNVSDGQSYSFEVPDGPSPGLILSASNCEASGVCVRTCPEGALALQTTGQVVENMHGSVKVSGKPVESVAGQTVLLQDPGRCSGCRKCLVVCPTNAISITQQATWQSLVSQSLVRLADEKTTKCLRCQTVFKDVEGRSLCPSCSFRRDNPFGSISPQQMLSRIKDRGETNPDRQKN